MSSHLGPTFVTPALGQSARVGSSVNVSIANNSDQAVVFNTELWDNDNIWAVGDPTKLVCRTAGSYLVVAHCGFTANSTGRRALGIIVNNTTFWSYDQRLAMGAGTGTDYLSTSTVIRLVVNDFVEMTAFQNSGGPLDARGQADYSLEFGMIRLSA